MTEYLVHETTPGERWDTIAQAYYGDARKIGPLVKANRALFLDDLSPIPLVFDKRITLRVPVIAAEDMAADDLPPWKRG